MIKYLRHTLIDKIRWNDCISKSLNRRVYGFSWYLDLVCPGWEALVKDDYDAVFPITRYHKWGFNYLAQPYFTQQLGVFSRDVLSETMVGDFILAIPPKFRFVEIQLNSMNRFPVGYGDILLHKNFELDMAPVYTELSGRYSQNTRRNLHKALQNEITFDHTISTDELIGLFRDNFGEKEGKLKEHHYLTLRKLILHCLNSDKGYILGTKTKNGLLSAAAFFLLDSSRIYFLFAASAPEARENGAMFLLIDRVIAENAGKSLLLDFEGGNDPNLGRFYKSFGALEVTYPALRINRLSNVAERGLKFIRKLRK